MTKTNNADAFKIQHDMLTTTGIWPKGNATKIYKIKAAISWIFTIGLCVTMGIEAICDLKDFTKLSEILYIQVTITATLIKLAFFTYRRKTFLKLLDFLKDPIFLSYSDNLDHYMARTCKFSALLANFYRYLIFCCIILYVVYPILDKTSLPFPFPYDLGEYTCYMYAFQIIGEGYCAWNNSCLDTLIASLMGIGAAQLDILCGKISNIKQEKIKKYGRSGKTDYIIINKLKQCVKHHIAIIKFLEYIEEIFTLGLLVQFVTSTIVICNTVFHIVLISRLNLQFFMLINYFLVVVAELFMYCWYGNEVIVKSVLVGEACYTFNWYNGGNEVRKYLFIMMERSKRPVTITALKFSTLSLTAFASILRWSYSCLALLMNMYQKRSTF